MSWNCRRELCRRAFKKQLEVYRWVDFLRHREDGIIVADMEDGVPVYITEVNGEIVVATEREDKYRTLHETWGEEVILIGFLKACDVEPIKDGLTPLDKILTRRVSA